jgi:hypothetical protein
MEPQAEGDGGKKSGGYHDARFYFVFINAIRVITVQQKQKVEGLKSKNVEVVQVEPLGQVMHVLSIPGKGIQLALADTSMPIVECSDICAL